MTIPESIQSTDSDSTKTDKTICTDDEVKELVMNATVTGYLEGTGTFILTHTGKESEGTRETFKITLLRDSGELLTCVNALLSSDFPVRLFVVASDTLVVLYGHLNPCILKTTSAWTNMDVLSSVHNNFFPTINSTFTSSLPRLNHTSNLAKVRQKGNYDFTIICDDNKEIKVHSLILSAQWNFFETMLESKMSEAATSTLRLRYPVEWIEAVVSHFYDERKPMDFKTATGVVIVAQIYDIPELLTKAIRRIKEEDMNIHQALLGWKRAHSVENKAVRDFCASSVSKEMTKLSGSKASQDILGDLTQVEFVQLFNDLSLSAKAAESKAAAETKKKVTNAVDTNADVVEYDDDDYDYSD